MKFLIYLADWLSAKYKLPHAVQDKTLQIRQRKLQAANDEAKR